MLIYPGPLNCGPWIKPTLINGLDASWKAVGNQHRKERATAWWARPIGLTGRPFGLLSARWALPFGWLGSSAFWNLLVYVVLSESISFLLIK